MNAYDLATAVYDVLIREIGRRAGQQVEPPAPPSVPLANWDSYLHRAEKLALAKTVTTDGTIPQLRSILGQLYQAQRAGFYAPNDIGTDAVRLIPQLNPIADIASRYQAIWNTLYPEWRKQWQNDTSPAVREANLHALLHRYTWTMAAPLTNTDTDNQTDINFYDYARMTAALAVCLAETDDLPPATPALLVGGDISGVQDWLYTFGSAGAAKSLRGRSFYLQLLSEVIALYVLRELALPQANLLYAGGGGFYLLAPVSKAAQIAELRKTISAKLLTMHEGALYLALDATPLTVEHLLGSEQDKEQRVGAAWSAVSRLLNQQKVRRFSELDDSAMAQVIGAPLAGTGEPDKQCAVCRRSILPGEAFIAPKLDEGEVVPPIVNRTKCGLCGSFETLGTQLRNAEFLVISDVNFLETDDRVIDWQMGLRRFGFDVQLCPNVHEAENGWAIDSNFVRIYTWQLQTTLSHFPGQLDKKPYVWAFRPLAQCVPDQRNNHGHWEIADFSDLAQASDGIKRWGVLRMDVDNLGTIFRSALPTNSLCGVVGVSGLLRLFFEGWVPQLAHRLNAESDKPRAYLIYAGGDDLFVVGSWSVLPGLAHTIRNEFSRFVCGNERVTISGGISLALDEKYPLYQAAREAGRAEEMAKDLPGKDGLAFLGQALKWGTDYDRVDKRVQKLVSWIAMNTSSEQHQRIQQYLHPLPRSFLMILRTIDTEWREWKKQENSNRPRSGIKPRYSIHTDKELYLGPWQWHLIYNLYRAAERTHDGELIREIKRLSEQLLAGEIKTIGLSGRWAELLTRTRGD